MVRRTGSEAYRGKRESMPRRRQNQGTEESEAGHIERKERVYAPQTTKSQIRRTMIGACRAAHIT